MTGAEGIGGGARVPFCAAGKAVTPMSALQSLSGGEGASSVSGTSGLGQRVPPASPGSANCSVT